MHNPLRCSISDHAISVVALAREVVESIQRKDRDLGSQLRRALSSIALNVAEGFGCTRGSARVRFETALGSLKESIAAIEVAVGWGYVSRNDAARLLASLDSLGARVYGLTRR
jgi:four helix bundle protein